jgi:transposase/DNA-binding CsgD family transcriptional regulator
VSRTSRCHAVGDHPAVTPQSGGRGLSSDKHLAFELQGLCAQAPDAAFRRKIEAVVLLLQHTDVRQIEHQAKASLRTVQRWAKRARNFGSGALGVRARNYQTSKLTDEQWKLVAAAVRRPPVDRGLIQPYWTAALLTKHLRSNLGIAFSQRHCRRLLTRLGATRPSPPAGVARRRRFSEDPIAGHKELAIPQPSLNDFEHKRQAWARIKRLASSGLPLQPFVYTLFDIVRDAVPYDEASPGLVAYSGKGPRWIVRDFNFERWFNHMQRYLLDASPEISGFRPPSLLPENPRTVLRHDEIVRPNYYRSEGYNEFFRSMGMHHGLLTLLRDQHGGFLGYYPIFRSEKMKPFRRDDIDFLQAVAPDVAQGIGTASVVAPYLSGGDPFAPFRDVPTGVVVMNWRGKVLSLNGAAKALFRQFAIYDNRGAGISANRGFSEALSHIARELRVIFGSRDELSIGADQPVVRMYAHRSGAILRLRGFLSDSGENSGHFTVLIELGETETLLRQRLSSRYRLSARQAELLMLLRKGASTKEMGERLDASASALKASLRELRLKLDLPDQSSLQKFTRLESSGLGGAM